MVDENELFNILDDGGAGVAPAKKAEGDSNVGNGMIAFSFKDSSNNVILPTLTADGKVPVTSDASGTCFYANGELAAGSLTIVDITNALVTINLTKEYSRIGYSFCSLQASLVQVVHVDDSAGTPTETVLAEAIVGAGAYSVGPAQLDCFILDTTGGTGVQELKLKGKNFRKLSSMRGSVACLEAA